MRPHLHSKTEWFDFPMWTFSAASILSSVRCTSRKRESRHMRIIKLQTSLRIRAVWSENYTVCWQLNKKLDHNCSIYSWPRKSACKHGATLHVYVWMFISCGPRHINYLKEDVLQMSHFTATFALYNEEVSRRETDIRIQLCDKCVCRQLYSSIWFWWNPTQRNKFMGFAFCSCLNRWDKHKTREAFVYRIVTVC